MLLIQKGLCSYCASRARVYININTHRARVFLRKAISLPPRETPEQATAIDRFAANDRGQIQEYENLTLRSERRVRPNIQQTRPKTRGTVGMRVAARRLTKTLPRVSYRAKANTTLEYRPRSFCGGLPARYWALSVGISCGHYRWTR